MTPVHFVEIWNDVSAARACRKKKLYVVSECDIDGSELKTVAISASLREAFAIGARRARALEVHLKNPVSATQKFVKGKWVLYAEDFEGLAI
jgi:hypothetical protein